MATTSQLMIVLNVMNTAQNVITVMLIIVKSVKQVISFLDQHVFKLVLTNNMVIQPHLQHRFAPIAILLVSSAMGRLLTNAQTANMDIIYLVLIVCNAIVDARNVLVLELLSVRNVNPRIIEMDQHQQNV
jgi:hypothetical protein